jgi:hypothetical protein
MTAPFRLREVSRGVKLSSAAMVTVALLRGKVAIGTRLSAPSKAKIDTGSRGITFSTKLSAALAAVVRAAGVWAALMSISSTTCCAATRFGSSSVSSVCSGGTSCSFS